MRLGTLTKSFLVEKPNHLHPSSFGYPRGQRSNKQKTDRTWSHLETRAAAAASAFREATSGLEAQNVCMFNSARVHFRTFMYTTFANLFPNHHNCRSHMIWAYLHSNYAKISFYDANNSGWMFPHKLTVRQAKFLWTDAFRPPVVQMCWVSALLEPKTSNDTMQHFFVSLAFHATTIILHMVT